MESLLAILFCIVPVEAGPIVDEVHVIERNWTYSYDTGKLSFVQLIFWDLGPYGAREVRDYRIIGDATYDRSKHHIGKVLRFIDRPQFYAGSMGHPEMREVRADLVLESVTMHEEDPEQLDSRFLPKENRLKLGVRQPKSRVRGR